MLERNSISYYLRGHPELSSFSRPYTEYAGGGGGQGLPCTRFKMLIISLHFHMEVAKIDISKVLFCEGGTEGSQKKEYSVTLLII